MPTPMIETYKRLLKDLRIDRENIKHEFNVIEAKRINLESELFDVMEGIRGLEKLINERGR